MDTFNLPTAVALLLGMVLGAVAAWLWLRSRSTLEIARARSEASVELASVRERASRIPMLEAQITKLLSTEQSQRAEILQLTSEQAERRQLLRSTEEQLIEAKAQLAQGADQIASLSRELTSSKERQATLASEAGRLPVLEQRIKDSESRASSLSDDLASTKESLGRVATELRTEREASVSLRGELEAARAELRKVQELTAQLAIEKADLTTRLESEREQAAEKLELLNEAKQSLSNQFKALANDILEEKSKRFAEQNQANLGQLLDPLKVKLTEFQSKVENVPFSYTPSSSITSSAIAATSLMRIASSNPPLAFETPWSGRSSTSFSATV